MPCFDYEYILADACRHKKPEVQECDATNDAISTKAGLIIFIVCYIFSDCERVGCQFCTLYCNGIMIDKETSKQLNTNHTLNK